MIQYIKESYDELKNLRDTEGNGSGSGIFSTIFISNLGDGFFI